MSEDESWTRRLEHGGREYVLYFSKRPFREGVEVRIELAGSEVFSIAELGLGESALIERVKAELDKL